MRQAIFVKEDNVYPNAWDGVAIFFVLGLIVLFAWAGHQMTRPYQLGEEIVVHLDSSYLPAYALHTTLRMFIALSCSLLFTFTFGTWAAKSKLAERFIVPMIDILQSVPVLGFLSVTVAGFIALFPGSLLGPECAAVFAIFTSQAWNMALGFYQTVRSVPGDLVEASDMCQLSAWQRFWRIEVPYSMPGLLWNMMLSMSASWFFVVASEAITVSNQTIMLPGIGSYIATAIIQSDHTAVYHAIITMLVVIFLYDQLLFRPLVVWAEKFKFEMTTQEQFPSSWVLTLFQRVRLLRIVGATISNTLDSMINISWFLRKKPRFMGEALHPRAHMWFALAMNAALASAVIMTLYVLIRFIFASVSLPEAVHVLYLGCVTGLRVVFLIIFSSIVWVPIGVWIGFRPRVSSIAQPVVQFLAAFPANLLFPVMVAFIVRYGLNVNVWVTPLMILGAQWYILFNVIAGASALPKDLEQVADNLGLKRWLRWRSYILPGIFPYYVTGAITAVGGAWNASIVAEVVNWGSTHLIATGLGAYIAEYTTSGDFPRIALGIGVMCLFVLVFNRIFWHPLYVYAQKRFSLE